MSDWWIYRGEKSQHDGIENLPDTPGWRKPKSLEVTEYRGAKPGIVSATDNERGSKYEVDRNVINAVNAAILLRRPLLITGKPGSGKSSLAYSIAWELKLGPVLKWPITTRSTLQDGLYRYDAIARLRDASLAAALAQAFPGSTQAGVNEQELKQKLHEDIGKYIELGPLGTALLPSKQPRVLLIDEIDKSDIDLPNDLLHIFEEGEFKIPELARLQDSSEVIKVLPFDAADKQDTVEVKGGWVHSQAFPIVVMTSNREKEFPPAFLRRCLQLHINPPDAQKLAKIVKLHFNSSLPLQSQVDDLIGKFEGRAANLATDQLLNAIYLAGHIDAGTDINTLLDIVYEPIDGTK